MGDSSHRLAAQQFFRGVIAMAPMATGGNLPYRRLCREYGAELTCSEMIVAANLVKGRRSEAPLLRWHPSEESFGVQLCGKDPVVVAEAARLATEKGCRFIDLNFGCPIDLIVRRGAGAALLKRPRKLAEVVAAVREATDLPLSVKIRAGWSERKINAVQVAQLVEEAGADALGVHGRTRAQRYKRSSDWGLIDQVAGAVSIPVLGNGDILTPWDLQRHRSTTQVRSFLIARGALVKPWIFTELRQEQPLAIGLAGRWAMMRRYYDLATEYFGDDEKGQQRVHRFFLWHLDFWHRYRPYTEQDYLAAEPTPLIQCREDAVTGPADAILLSSSDPEDFQTIWRRVLDREYPAE